MNGNSKQALTVAFLLAVSIVVWDEIHNNHEWPKPARFVGAGVAYGLLGFMSPVISPKLAAWLGWGFLIALAYKTYNKNAQPFVTPPLVGTPSQSGLQFQQQTLPR